MGAIEGVLFDFDGTLAELHIDFQAMRKQVADLAALFLDQNVEPDSHPVLEWIEKLAERMSRELPQAEVLEFQSRCRMRLVGLEMKAAKKGKLFPYTRGVLAGLREAGVLMVGFGPRRIRAVTHLDVDDGGIQRAVEALAGFMEAGG